jgi:hypothetical protein
MARLLIFHSAIWIDNLFLAKYSALKVNKVLTEHFDDSETIHRNA